MMQERRKFERFKVMCTAFYKVLGSSSDDTASRLVDISKGGLRLSDARSLRAGSPVELNIVVPGYSSPIVAFAESVWSKQSDNFTFNKGLRFTKIDSDDRRRLLDYAISCSA